METHCTVKTNHRIIKLGKSCKELEPVSSLETSLVTPYQVIVREIKSDTIVVIVDTRSYQKRRLEIGETILPMSILQCPFYGTLK